jgi:cobalt-zinc-cadmium efflux system outer membrane protein
MQVGVFQLLQAKQNEADARRDYIEAQRDYWIARGDLDRAVNGGGGDLAPVTWIERSNGGREGD